MHTPTYFPFVLLDAFVVMPNHVHGIIIIDKPNDDRMTATADAGVDAICRDAIGGNVHCRDAINRVSTGGFAKNINPMLNDNLSRIIRWYKGRATFEMRQIHADFAWQSRFHDHIIRNQESFDRISNYIINNPAQWENDKFYIK